MEVVLIIVRYLMALSLLFVVGFDIVSPVVNELSHTLFAKLGSIGDTLEFISWVIAIMFLVIWGIRHDSKLASNPETASSIPRWVRRLIGKDHVPDNSK